MEHALKLLQIAFRGNRDMFFDFELEDVSVLEPFLLDDYMYMSTVTAFPTKDEMKARVKTRSGGRGGRPQEGRGTRRAPETEAAAAARGAAAAAHGRRGGGAARRRPPPPQEEEEARIASMKEMFYWMLDQHSLHHHPFPDPGDGKDGGEPSASNSKKKKKKKSAPQKRFV